MNLQRIYNQLKDKNEVAILEEYNCNAKRYTTALTSKTIFSDTYNFYLTYKL